MDALRMIMEAAEPLKCMTAIDMGAVCVDTAISKSAIRGSEDVALREAERVTWDWTMLACGGKLSARREI